jgi:hypothetical protein
MRFNARGGLLDAEKIRELASWYRANAERAGSPVIWEARLRMAEDLELEADRLSVRTEETARTGRAASQQARTSAPGGVPDAGVPVDQAARR